MVTKFLIKQDPIPEKRSSTDFDRQKTKNRSFMTPHEKQRAEQTIAWIKALPKEERRGNSPDEMATIFAKIMADQDGSQR